MIQKVVSTREGWKTVAPAVAARLIDEGKGEDVSLKSGHALKWPESFAALEDDDHAAIRSGVYPKRPGPAPQDVAASGAASDADAAGASGEAASEDDPGARPDPAYPHRQMRKTTGGGRRRRKKSGDETPADGE